MQPSSYDPTLLAALGEATVEFSLIEHFVSFGIALLTFGGDGAGQEKAELITAGMSLNDKVNLLSRLHHQRFAADAEAERQMSALSAAIDAVREERNALQHSLWLLYNYGSATTVSVKHSRRGVKRTVREVTTTDLQELVTRVRQGRNQSIDFVHAKLPRRLRLCNVAAD